MPENLHRLIELLNLQWLFQDRDRADLKNPIEDLAVRVTCDHDNVEVRINLLGCFIGSVATLQEWSDKLGRYGPRTLSGRSVQVAPI